MLKQKVLILLLKNQKNPRHSITSKMEMWNSNDKTKIGKDNRMGLGRTDNRILDIYSLRSFIPALPTRQSRSMGGILHPSSTYQIEQEKEGGDTSSQLYLLDRIGEERGRDTSSQLYLLDRVGVGGDTSSQLYLINRVGVGGDTSSQLYLLDRVGVGGDTFILPGSTY